MSRRPRKPRQPSYRLHRPSAQAVVTIDGRDRYLGPHGSPESHREYAEWIAKWRANHGSLGGLDSQQSFANLSVNEMLEICWTEEFEPKYSKDGKPTTEAANLLLVIRTVSKLFGLTLARDFGPKKLKKVRKHMVTAQDLARTEVNKRIGLARRIFKHAVSEELVPPSVYQGLQTVVGLREGQGEVRESKPVKPVPDLWVCLVLPFVARQIVSMILVQRITGMRPGEVVIMRPTEIDTRGPVWEYRPFKHKNKWRGYDRIIPLGPFAQEVLKPFLDRPGDTFLFSPKEAEKERKQERRKNRQTPLTPSQRARKPRRAPKRAKRDRYDRDSYRRAIEYGIKKANRNGIIIPHWHPHQLRHNHGTAVREVFSVEEACTSLGTGTAVVEVYAERNLELAIKVAKRMG